MHALFLKFYFREKGGREAEQAERQRWNQREHQRILDSVKGTNYILFITKY